MGMVEQDKELLRLETMDPVEFLSQYTGGRPVPKHLVQVIQELRHRYAFSNGVINGLLEYCLLKNNYQIELTMVMELAEELREAGVRSGREAFTHLKSLKWVEEEEERGDEYRAHRPPIARIAQGCAKEVSADEPTFGQDREKVGEDCRHAEITSSVSIRPLKTKGWFLPV
jgi:hypothetical protein